MSRTDRQRIDDILEAIEAIRAAQSLLGENLIVNGVVFDALCYRLISIGEAVKGLTKAVTFAHPSVPWRDIAGLRDIIAHEYHRRDLAIILRTVDEPLQDLEKALRFS